MAPAEDHEHTSQGSQLSMRSSKPRSRNKNNRNRSSSLGNVVNRVFDSSGPEGKVRGTPQQIIDKYNQLARDAQLSNDRVAAENFQQHAEYYLRMLSDAQKEMEARREQQERENRERQIQRDRERNERQERQERESNSGGDQNQQSSQPAAKPAQQPAAQPVATDPSMAPQPDVIETKSDDTSAIVDTPESAEPPKPKKPRAPRKPRRKPEAKDDAPKKAAKEASSEKPAAEKPSDGDGTAQPDAAE